MTAPRDGPAAPVLLAIETAGSNCSAAVARGDAVVASECRALRHGHAEALFPMIEQVMAEAAMRPSQLGSVAAAIGPGGFTGIRVGLAAAHGIALAVGARLIGVTGFAAVAASVGAAAGSAADGDDRAALLVALDSRRADLYVQLFAPGTVTPLAAPAALLPECLADYVARLAGDMPMLIAGDAAEAAAAALGQHAGLAIARGSAPDARGVIAAALHQMPFAAAADPVRPFYLRPPDVTLPRQTPAGLATSQRVTALPAAAAVPLALMHRACFPEDPWDADALARILALAGGFGYLAWQGDSPVGFVLARDLGGEVEILSLGVLPEWRRHGIGRALLDSVVAEAGVRKIGSTVLEVAADNAAARRLYATVGFVQAGMRPRYYRRLDGRADALILRRGIIAEPATP
jgi:tRNA threonylcarbamoyladenosine biosynthesis protein TsaB